MFCCVINNAIDMVNIFLKEDIIACKELGVDGIVSGVLNEDNTIDIERTKELIELSKVGYINFVFKLDDGLL